VDVPNAISKEEFVVLDSWNLNDLKNTELERAIIAQQLTI